jgi:hypothetical protein
MAPQVLEHHGTQATFTKGGTVETIKSNATRRTNQD